MVELECKAWASKQINIKYEVRSNRKGYKAGALKKGMEHYYAQQCDFVAIFDADFQPQSDFLMRTIPFLLHNPKIALVQARWEFGMQVLTNITTISVLQYELLDIPVILGRITKYFIAIGIIILFSVHVAYFLDIYSHQVNILNRGGIP